MKAKCTACGKLKHEIPDRTYRRKTRDGLPYVCCKCKQERKGITQ